MSTPPPPAPPPFVEPDEGPSASDVADRELWDTTAAQSLTSVEAAAEKWRTGLAALVTLATGGLLVKGTAAASDIKTWALAVITVLGSAGLALAILGLWNALAAAAGTPAAVSYDAVVEKYGSYQQFQVAAAKAAASKLANARQLVIGALIALGLTVIAWWWAPAKQTHLVKVTYGKESVCGKLMSADGQNFVVKPDGASKSTTVAFNAVGNIAVVDKC